jgi:cobyrinic acid a,c-diamide synthase
MIRFLVSAAHKSSGKTTISTGLCAAFAGLGKTVQPFKKGPDYIDPMWLGQASGRACRNLDFYTQSEDEILTDFAAASAGADVTLIEGNKGLYDGLDPAGSDSTAALAKLLGLPVILVLDTQGITRGIAPLILGYQSFHPHVEIAGVILNKVASDRHEGKLHAAVSNYTDTPVLGAVHRNRDLEIAERHIGLMPTNEDAAAAARIEGIAVHVAEHVDLELLERVVGAVPASVDQPPISAPVAPPLSAGPRPRIGVPRDGAFGFYYEADLEALEAAGADLVVFDALKDAHLPAVDGLFISGGFPEIKMHEVEANASLRAEIAAAIENDLPVYAECGGLMYLARRISWRGETCEMVGALPVDVVMTERPVGRGYVRLAETGEGPWPRPSDGDDDEFPAHEFHYSRLENLGGDLRFAYKVRRGTGIDGKRDGIVYRNVLASYAHLRDVAGNRWTRRYVDFVQRRAAAGNEKRAQA